MAHTQRVRVGVIGAGFARTTQIPCFQACEATQVVAVASARRERAETLARERGIPCACADWRELVAHPEVDLVSIAAPPLLHEEMALGALRAGKAVLCEKPTALDATQAERMWREARARGALALLDHELRFVRARQALRELVRAGELGAVRHVRVVYRSDARASPERAWDWWSDAARGGGVLGAIGSHAVDTLRWLLDEEPTHVLGALATHTPTRRDPLDGQERPVTADEQAQVLLRFGSGAAATLQLSSVEAGRPEHALEVFGARGALRLERTELSRARVGAPRWERVETPPDEALPEGVPDTEWARGFLRLARSLTGALRTGHTALPGAATFEDGWRNQQVLDAARRSHARQAWVVLEPGAGDEVSPDGA
jgi:predicted dehydrogenase